MNNENQFKCDFTLYNTNNAFMNAVNRNEIRACVYSPYDDLFAWSTLCGYVNIVNCKQLDLHTKFEINRNKTTTNTTENEKDNYLIEDLKESSLIAVIDCSESVWSLAFGSSKPQVKCERKYHKQRKAVHNRFDLTDKLILAVGLESGKIRIYNMETMQFLYSLCDHRGIVRDLQFTKNGSFQLASVSRDETVKLWDMFNDGNMYKTLVEHTGWIYACDWSPTAPLLCTVGSNRKAIVWDTETYKIKFNLKGHMHDVVTCEFSPDGALLATGSYDTKICVWNPFNANLMKQFYHLLPPPRAIFAGGYNGAYIRAINFSPDGTQLVSLCDDKVWSMTSRSNSLLYESDLNDGICCTYSSDGLVIFVGTRSSRVDIYKAPIKVQKLVDICRKYINQYVERKNIDKLHLPRDLAGYLCYEDIQTIYPEQTDSNRSISPPSNTGSIFINQLVLSNNSSEITTNNSLQQQCNISMNLQCY